MEASGGWTIISQAEENINSIVPVSSSEPSINDYFEKVGENERKCRLCFATVKVNHSNWNMKSHFKHKHSTEWSTKFEPFLKTKPKVRFHYQDIERTEWVAAENPVIVSIFFSFQNNAAMFELISPDEAQFNGNGPIIKDEANSYQFDCDQTESIPMNPKTVDFDSVHSVGGKRAKFTHLSIYDSTDYMNDSSQALSDSNEIDAPHASGTMQIDEKDGVAKDELTIFGEFIVSELRNLKTEQFRRKFKIIVQKSLVDVMEEEEAMLAKRDE